MAMKTKLTIITVIAAGMLAGGLASVPDDVYKDWYMAIFHPLAISAPISINGNVELAAAADRGSGTSLDPYVIEYKNFTGITGTHALRVMNTDAHVIIQNNLVHQSKYTYGLVSLHNARNVQLLGNNITNARYIGINIEYCNLIHITGNSFAGCGWAIYVGTSTNVTITRNAFGINPVSGMADGILHDASGYTFNGNWWADYAIKLMPSAMTTTDGVTWDTSYPLMNGAYDHDPLINNPARWYW